MIESLPVPCTITVKDFRAQHPQIKLSNRFGKSSKSIGAPNLMENLPNLMENPPNLMDNYANHHLKTAPKTWIPK
jgi:hypothetical protein